MAYISLYRKYRPKKFKDVVGQEIVIKILKNSILEGKIAHAYIFAGPRGVGKTSIAKIFAKAVNCINPINGDLCNECEVCLNNSNNEIDIVEIDAASNNGVDEIREIRNNIKLLPSKLKYKVYIIDEVHMLSLSAFNALLKTLEEPPSHAIFILATTESNKIPSTVISRCQKFDFEKLSSNLIENQLKKILEAEGINGIDNEIIKLIAEISDGGMRDAINLLDQIISLNKENITKDDVYKIIGEISDSELIELLNEIFLANMQNLLKLIEKFYEKGCDFNKICNKMQVFLRDILIYKHTKKYFDSEYEDKLEKFCKHTDDVYINMCKELFSLSNELKKTNEQRILIEIYFIKLVLLLSNETSTQEKAETHEIINTNKEIIEEKDNNFINNLKKIRINNAFSGANKNLKMEFLKKFKNIDEYTSSKKYNSIISLLKKSSVEVVSDSNIIFSFQNNFDEVLFDKNFEEIDEFISKIYGNKFKTVAITVDKWNEIKEKYINNVKSGIIYNYIDEEKNIKILPSNSELELTLNNIFGENYIKID